MRLFNAVTEPAELPQIKASVPGLLTNVQFVHGEQYHDFNPALDEVVSYSIGGLVAGKGLAKGLPSSSLSLASLLGRGWALPGRPGSASSTSATRKRR